MRRNVRGPWLAAALAGLLAAAACDVAARQTDGAALASGPGGPFSLIDHTGRQVTEADFLGQPMVVYFGFASCPDICPISLQKLAVALDSLGEDAAAFQTVLITVDPERDTADRLAAYVSSNGFPDNLVGLTGSPEEIAEAARGYKVYYERIEDPDSYASYQMAHTSILYLMDAEGRFVDAFSHDDSPDAMAQGLRRFLSESGAARRS